MNTKLIGWPEQARFDIETKKWTIVRRNMAKDYEMRLMLLEEWAADKDFQEWCVNRKRAKDAKDIAEQLPDLLDQGNMIWCRRGSVCLDATPCEDLECSFKHNKDDMVRGAVQCRTFQITNRSNDWTYAHHICEYGSVEPFDRGK